jgi:hypothetical protein
VDGTFPTNLGPAWSFGASLFTFIFPMCLFIVVATILYLEFTRPRRSHGARDLILAVGRTGPSPDSSQPGMSDSGAAQVPEAGAPDET